MLLTLASILFFFTTGEDVAVVAAQGGAVDWMRGMAAGFVTLWSLSFFLFWVPILVVCLYNGALRERYWVTGVFFFVILASFIALGLFAPLVWAAENPYTAIMVVGGYFLGAALWMTFRWFKFIEKVRDERNVQIAKYLTKELKDIVFDRVTNRSSRSNKDIDFENFELPAAEQQWYDEVKANGVAYEDQKPDYLTKSLSDYLRALSLGTATSAPLFRENKAKFFTYFFYWPLDFVIYVFGELLQDIWENIVRLVQGMFDGYAKKRIKQKIDI